MLLLREGNGSGHVSCYAQRKGHPEECGADMPFREKDWVGMGRSNKQQPLCHGQCAAREWSSRERSGHPIPGQTCMQR